MKAPPGRFHISLSLCGLREAAFHNLGISAFAKGFGVTSTYAQMGRRIAKKFNRDIVEKYLWQDATTLLAVYDGDDNLLQRFEYADGRMPESIPIRR